MRNLLLSTAGLTLTLLGQIDPSSAMSFKTYDDQAEFLAETNATALSPYPELGFGLDSFSHDGVTVSPVSDLHPDAPDPTLVVQRRSIFPDGAILVTGQEDFDIDLSGPVNSFGFEFYEPTATADPANYVDSTFEVTLFLMEEAINNFEFSPVDGVLSFFGVLSDMAFDRITIREIVGGTDDEAIARIFVGQDAVLEEPTKTPEPGLALGSLGLLGFAAIRKFR